MYFGLDIIRHTNLITSSALLRYDLLLASSLYTHIHSLTHSLTHIHSLTHTHTHSLIYSLTHS